MKTGVLVWWALALGVLFCATGVLGQNAVCGDQVCAPGVEDCGSCLQDCPCPGGQACDVHVCVPANLFCGDQVCSGGIGEDCLTCQTDCACQLGLACIDRQCVPGPPSCGNQVPEAGEDCINCPQDVAFKPTATVSKSAAHPNEVLLFQSNPNLLLLPQDPPASWNLGNGTMQPGAPIDLSYAFPSAGTFWPVITAIERNCLAVRVSDPVKVVVGANNGGGGMDPKDPDANSVPGGSTLVDVAWSDWLHENGFEVWRRDRPDDPWQWVATLPANATSYRDQVDSMPPPGGHRQYDYRVFPRGVGPQSPPITDAHLYSALPTAPHLIGPKLCVATTRPTFGWHTGLRAELWRLQVQNADSGETLFDGRLAELRHTLATELERGTAYRFRVHALNNVPEDDGEGPWSEYMYFMPYCEEISPPFLVEPWACTSGLRPTLSWTAVEGARSYRVKVHRLLEGGGDDQLVYYEDVQAPATDFAIPQDLVASNEYRFSVKASNGAVDGPWSRLRYFTPQCGPNLAPGTSSPVSPWEVAVPSPTPAFAWEAARGGESYRLIVRKLATNEVVIDRSYAGGEVCVGRDCEARPGVSLAAGRYYWEVWAANAHGTATHAVQPRFDVPAFPTLTIGDGAVVEGDGGLVALALAVTLSSPAAAPVRFHWATRDVSARQGTDYGAASGEVTIAAGESTAALELSVLGDLVYEGDESFEVVLSDVVGAALGDGVGLARILDDDPAPQVRIGDGRVVEGNAPASAKLRFEVTLSGATEVTATVRVVTDGCTASTGTDFTPLDEVVSFAPGEIAKAIEVEVPGDPDFEGDEILFAHLSVPTAATITDAEGLGVVANDDPPVWGGPWPLPPAADFDGDGYGDLAFRNDDSGALVAWLLEGIVRREGAFFSPSAPADGNWMPVALGDFDGDGDADLVFQNIDSGRLSIWHLNELLRVSATLLDGPRDRAWRPVGAADLDGDGHTDLLWQHRGSGALLAWLFDAAGGHREAASSPRTTGDAALEIAALGDVDADGAVDFLLRHAVTGALSAWRMDGLQRIEELPVTPAAVPDLSWRLVAASDVDRSGSLDLVWQHATSRRIVAWLMQGTTRQCGAYTVPDGPAALNWSVFGPR